MPAAEATSERIWPVRLRSSLLFSAIGLLGAGTAVLPAIAASETPTIKAYSYLGKNYWSPPSATVGAGGAVNLGNTSGELHGVEWREGPESPICSGVPLGAGNWSKEWSGSCTFAKAGTYIFWCTVHHSEMTGTITVNTAGTTTIATTNTTTSTQPTPSPGPTTTTSPSTSGSGSALGAAAPSPLAGAAGTAVTLASRQRGRAVHGAVAVSQAGTGGRLEVELLAARVSLASATQPRTLRVGRIVRSALSAGTQRFSVPLATRARRALARHGRLPLRVKLVVRPVNGAAVTVLRSVLLKP
jgi:plastocyanin